MIKDAIAAVLRGARLSAAESEAAIDEVMRGEATPAQIAGFAIALAFRGETAEELAGCVRAMRRHATRVPVGRPDAIDNCGTGGDGLSTFNISTTAAFVAAGADCAVAKHGNRASSSRCGSAEVLEALGVALDLPPAKTGQAVDEIGIGFLYAPLLHGALRHAAAPRKELGVRTVFNLLGPMANPAGVRRQVIGVARPEHVHLVAEALRELGSEHALVLHGAGGADELTLAGPNMACELKGGEIRELIIDARELGLAYADIDALRGGDAAENARISEGVLRGERGPRYDVVALNAAAAIYIGGQAADLREGLRRAEVAIDSGAAAERLRSLIAFGKREMVG